jgi:DNA helicase II / ATP-dependent DNA helicase PcrA
LRNDPSINDELFYRILSSWLFGNFPPSDPKIWKQQIALLDIALAALCGKDNAIVHAPFTEWVKLNNEHHQLVAPNLSRNFYYHTIGQRTLSIEVNTIHAVKGETHSATLVLECYLRAHDLQRALPFLIGTATEAERRNSATLNHLKRLFVAASRPKEVLCFAIHRDHLGEGELKGLEAIGWSITHI